MAVRCRGQLRRARPALGLMRCDNLIDQIVYKLYDLTEEEIAIVEGRQLKNKEQSTQHADGQDRL